MIAKVLQHLPAYSPNAEPTSKLKEMGQWVSSVYLDSPDFESYRCSLRPEAHGRARRAERAQLHVHVACGMYVYAVAC